ncbi:MAG: diaminopimelate decarboxylase [Dehalococcoidales bacterium]|nr:diaminopimelate decarboxylase [Dehalococcoidales bacterium]
MHGKQNEKYEKPTLTKHYRGFMNKFARAGSSIPHDTISGVPVRGLVEQFGSPLWVVSEADLREKYKDLYRAFSARYPKVAVAYSYKTNYLSGICALLHQEGAWAEVVSGFEYDIAVKLGVPGDQIVFNGPYKTRAELERAIKQKSKINIDSFQEIDDLERLAKELGEVVKVGIRVNMQLRKVDWSRFGFNLESGQAIDACKRVASSDNLRLSGLHVHMGTFILNTKTYRALAEKLLGLYMAIKDTLKVEIEYLDVGGGYASTNTLHYHWIPGEYACPAIDEYAEAICSPLVTELRKIADMPLLIIEPGRALVDEGMYLITTVVSLKALLNNYKGVVIDAGVNLLPTCFWYRFNIRAAERPASLSDGDMTNFVNIYGPLCMNIDCIQLGTHLPSVTAGDILVISNVGAYNFSQSMQFIRPRPAVVMITEDGVEYLRLPETTEYICQLERVPGHLLKKFNSVQKGR